MNRVMVNIKIARAKDIASPASNIHVGTGKIIMQMTPIKSIARTIVGGNRVRLANAGFDPFLLRGHYARIHILRTTQRGTSINIVDQGFDGVTNSLGPCQKLF